MGLLPGVDSLIPFTANRTGKFPCIRLSARCFVSSVDGAMRYAVRSSVAAEAEDDLVVDSGGRHRADVVHLEAGATDKPQLTKRYLKPSPRSLRLT